MKEFFSNLFSRKLVLLAFIVVLVFALIALFAPFLAPYDPAYAELRRISEPSSADHLLGTDQLGRDILSRLIYGAQISFTVGVMAVLLAAVVGMLLGMVAGYFGGVLDMIIMRVTEMLISIPQVVFAIAVAAVIGGGVTNVTLLLGISILPSYIRMMRGQTIQIRDSDFIMAGRLSGVKSPRILLRHILPNCLSPMIVLMTQNIGGTILTEASLSYLGLGITPPTATWGSMVKDGTPYLMHNPRLALLPGLCIILLVLGFNFLGDGLRDTLDPRLRGTL
jgi:peptide/nickel transport system permease protein